MTDNGRPLLQDDVVSLREVTLADARALYRWRSDPRSRDCFRATTLGSYESHLRFVQRHLASDSRDRWFVIEAEGRPVGSIALYDFAEDSRSAEWGRLVVDPDLRGRGYGRRALELLIDLARKLGLDRLRCEVLVGNTRAEGLYRSLGFVETRRESVAGRHFQHLHLALGDAMSNPIHLFVPSFRTDEVLEEIRTCLERGWTGLGFKTVELEKAWQDYSGFEHAHFMNSASAGLHLAVKLLKLKHGWQDGDEVISTPLTFVSTNHAIAYENLRPVFADVDDFLCLDPESVAARIGPRTRAVCFVGMGGNPGQYDAVRKLCDKHGLALILDAAHMAGTWIDGPDGRRHAGHDADATVFSFQAVKNLPTADSGMLCFRDAGMDADARKWAWLGINKDTYTRTVAGGRYTWLYDVEHVGYKYHGNSIMAAMGLVGLRYLERDNATRRGLADAYDAHLADCTGVLRVPMAPHCVPSRHLYQVRVADRDEVLLRLHAQDVYPGVHYRDNTLYRMYADQSDTCPRARLASDELISLPMHLRLQPHEVERVAAALRKALA